ncbi:hypothetical protein YN1_7220 [Nanoarchaeota archaeon]
MNYKDILPQYPFYIKRNRDNPIKFIKLSKTITEPKTDIPMPIYLFAFCLLSYSKNLQKLKDNPEEIKKYVEKLWNEYKEKLKQMEKDIDIPIITWKGKEMFKYILEPKPSHGSTKKSDEKYMLYLKVNWKVFLDFLENWPKELLEKDLQEDKSSSISKLYGFLNLNWKILYYNIGELYEDKNRNIDFIKSLNYLGEYKNIENIIDSIINILSNLKCIMRNVFYIKEEERVDTTIFFDIIRQMEATAVELKNSILSGNIRSSYILLRNISEDLLRLDFIADNKINDDQQLCLIYSYMISSIYSKNFKKICINKDNCENPLDNYCNNEQIEKIEKVYNMIDSEDIYLWYKFIKFQKENNIPIWQVSYNYAKKENQNINIKKLGVVLENTSKVVHNNVIIPSSISILEFKYFKYLLIYFLEALEYSIENIRKLVGIRID